MPPKVQTKTHSLNVLPDMTRVYVAAGYFTFLRFVPKWEDKLTAGGIALPQTVTRGANEHSEMTWGRVIKCGSSANRATTEPFNPEVQAREGFPLEPGSWVACRGANHWTVLGELKGLQTHDVVLAFPPDMRWADIEATLRAAQIRE